MKLRSSFTLKTRAKRTQHCWPITPIFGCYMLRPFAHPVACCWMLLRRVWTGQIFQPTTPNISFVPWSPKRSATMLDPFAELFQHCWGHARSLRMVYKDLWVVSFPRCTAGPNIVSPTMLGPFAHSLSFIFSFCQACIRVLSRRD